MSNRQRTWALALLFCAAVLNLFDRQIVNILAQDIKRALTLSDTELGLLTGTAFGLFYALLGIPLGRLGDRVDRVKLMAAALALWSGFTALCGIAGGFLQLFLSRMGVGVGEAASQPASTALIADLFPEGQRTSAMAILLAGAPVGGLLGLIVGGYVGMAWGWRSAFFVAAIPGLILSPILLVTVRDPRSQSSIVQTHKISVQQTIAQLARNPRFRWLMIGLTCVSFLPYASGAWLPPFFIRVHRMTTGELGEFAGLAVGLGGTVGTVGSGWLCDRLRTRTRNVELKVLATALSLGCLCLSLTLFSPQRSIALLSMFAFDICAYAFLGPIVTLIQGEADVHSRALAIALCVSVSNIINLCLALPLVGFISDVLNARQGVRAIADALEIGAIVTGALGLLAFWKARKA